jgi:hypothetical protein
MVGKFGFPNRIILRKKRIYVRAGRALIPLRSDQDVAAPSIVSFQSVHTTIHLIACKEFL